jgi:hypothetical protein
MSCNDFRDRLFSRIDGEISDFESRELESHLEQCASCRREYRLFSLPNQIAKAIPSITPSPFFYARLNRHIEGEAQRMAGWQSFLELARQMIPTLAGITLVLFSVFAYFELRGPEADLYSAYQSAFIVDNQPQHMLDSEQMPITDESVLSAIAERQLNNQRKAGTK